MKLLLSAPTLTARCRQNGLPSQILLGIRLYLVRLMSAVWLNTSICCYIWNFRIPGKHSLERIWLNQIVLWTVQKSMETSETMVADLIWFKAWNANVFLYNFTYRMSWILQSIFFLFGWETGCRWVEYRLFVVVSDILIPSKNYWLISLFLYLVTIIYL